MGKSKKRSFQKGINNLFQNITRSDALNYITESCSKNYFDDEIKNLILLFGFSYEELLEQGIKYEDVMSLKPFLK